MMRLFEQQQEIYQFIREKIETRGCGPTVGEIGVRFDIETPNRVMRHLNALVALGLILREGRSSTDLIAENGSLHSQVEELQNRVAALKDQAAVRESFITDLMDQKRCPDCERPRRDWYTC